MQDIIAIGGIMRAFVIGTALIALPAAAHNWDAKPLENPDNGSPFEAWEGWRSVGTTSNGDAVGFVGHIERVGQAVTFETVAVYRTKIAQNGQMAFDQEHAHWIGECSSMSLRNTHKQDFLFRGPTPPPPITTMPSGADRYRAGLFSPKGGTLLHEAMRMACGHDYPETVGQNPYATAQEYFRANPLVE